MGRRLLRWCLAAYWLLLVLGTHWPSELLPGAGRDMPGDKRLHLMAYAGLAGLLAAVLTSRLDGSRPAGRGMRQTVIWSIAAVAIAVAFGLVDEATQPWTGRDFEWADWHADIAGAIVGAAVAAGAVRLWMRPAQAAEPGSVRVSRCGARWRDGESTSAGDADQIRAQQPRIDRALRRP